VIRFNPKLESAPAGRAFKNVSNDVAGPLRAGKDLLQRARSAYYAKRSVLYCLQDLAHEITVFVWRVHPPSLKESIASGAHCQEQFRTGAVAWRNIPITLVDARYEKISFTFSLVC
jgi:hypothetical protein